jgi:hypothetical protein
MRYTRRVLEQEADRLFGYGGAKGVLPILDEYKSDKGRERVQLAILKLSEGKIDKLRHYLDVAKKDFRDVLSWSGLPPERDDDQ